MICCAKLNVQFGPEYVSWKVVPITGTPTLPIDSVCAFQEQPVPNGITAAWAASVVEKRRGSRLFMFMGRGVAAGRTDVRDLGNLPRSTWSRFTRPGGSCREKCDAALAAILYAARRHRGSPIEAEVVQRDPMARRSVPRSCRRAR